MKISKRDWVQLSAYLDGELNQRDLTRLENRIKTDPEFQAALDGLKDVKAVLAHTPRLAVPRSFTLKPALVQSSPRRAPARGYGLAAAALSFLFVTVVTLDVGSGILQGGLSAARAPLAEEIMLDSAVEEVEELEMMAAAEAVEAEAVPAAEMEEALDEGPAPTAEIAEAPLAPEFDPPGEGIGGGIDEGEPDAKVPSEDGEMTLGEAEDAAQDDTQNALGEEADFGPEETQIPSEPELYRPDRPLQISWLRVLEIIFGLGAIGFGIAAWRRSR